MTYGISRTVDLSYEQAIERITEALRKEEFGILTTIDVQETLKKKLNVDFKKYMILGACNPPFAHQALQIEEQLGLLLPCNVIVYEQGTRTVVAAFDPMVMTVILDNPHLRPVAEEVKRRLERALANI